MYSTSKITLSKEALESNISFIKHALGEDVILSSVIKGNAYGHGIEAIAPLIYECGVNHFSVFSSDEAYRAYQVLPEDATIMIMGAINFEDFDWLIAHDIEFFVFDMERVKCALESAKRLQKAAKVHIELETGMNRTGFVDKDLKPLVEILLANEEYLTPKGVCTHYAGAESIANYVRVQKQIKTFRKLLSGLKKHGVKPEQRHTACSAAAMSYPKTRMDLVRIGILQYGFWPSREVFIDYLAESNQRDKPDPLRRVISWESYIMSIKSVKTGEFIGYGTSYLAQQDMIVAAVPVGYAHGYSRVLSNQGRILVNGRRVGVVGIVNMNMMVIDVTDVPDVATGTKITLIGSENNIDITVASFGELSNQLNYELLTRLPHDIPRIIE